MAMPRRSGGRPVMSRPATSTRPAPTVAKPEIARRSVVLPQPDEPRSATNSPGAISSETPFSTVDRTEGDLDPLDGQRVTRHARLRATASGSAMATPSA